jgi:hypothetical protein
VSTEEAQKMSDLLDVMFAEACADTIKRKKEGETEGHVTFELFIRFVSIVLEEMRAKVGSDAGFLPQLAARHSALSEEKLAELPKLFKNVSSDHEP